jgi:hypothetical protein
VVPIASCAGIGADRGGAMFNPTEIVIDAFVDNLQAHYRRTYGRLEPDYPEIIAFVGRVALENIANSDAPYHDVHHTIMVTEVGQQILRGKHLSKGGVKPRDWLNFTVALLCHDIGYVRGICDADRPGRYVVDESGGAVSLPPGATDASLTPYHVARSKLFIRERFGKVRTLDAEIVESYIERTRFPVPQDGDHAATHDFPGLLRAADLIGQLADPFYPRKLNCLFYEFEEIGANKMLGYRNPGELRKNYPKFYWRSIYPYVRDALRYLALSQYGKQIIANLYSHVFVVEHDMVDDGMFRQELMAE